MAYRLALVAALASGCVVGGGPYVGYGQNRGFIYGVEAGTGMPIVQLAVGMQNKDRFGYFRIDVTGNTAGYKRLHEFGVGGRVGVGYGTGKTHGSGGVFAMGANVGFNFERPRCSDAGTVGLLGVELRYAGGETQFVATSRVEQVSDLCWH